MLNTPIYDIVHTSGVAKTYGTKQSRDVHSRTVSSRDDAANYDSFSISDEMNTGNHFQKELVGRLSQEIRTSTTTGRIQELHQAVISGEYRPDPAKIAKCILNQWEV